MANKIDTTLSKQQLAAQLKKPEGTNGREVGKQMNIGNEHICLNSYKILDPKPHSLILEIGMGNGLFIKNLLALTSNLKYVGVDYSQTMIEEALILNADFMESEQVSFIKGSIETLPFEDNSIDYITTTNTIYFWPNLSANAQEIHRVLKPNGKVLIAYRPVEFLDKTEFTKYGFNKYTNVEVENLLVDSGFREVTTEIVSEPDLEFAGESIKLKGLYSIGVK